MSSTELKAGENQHLTAILKYIQERLNNLELRLNEKNAGKQADVRTSACANIRTNVIEKALSNRPKVIKF